VADHLGKAPGLEVRRVTPIACKPGDVRVMLDFFTGGPSTGPFITLTVPQWTVLQQLARSIGWPSPPAA
jgi:hypothetical protein